MWGAFFISHLWQMGVMAILLAGSAFFSGSETALFSLSAGQLHRLSKSGRSGRIVASLAREPRELLNALLLGNLIINVAYTAIAATIVFDLGDSELPAWSAPVGSLAALVVLILAGEVAPKIIALTVTRRWAMLCGPIVAGYKRIVQPVLWFTQHVAIDPITKIIAPERKRGGEISAGELGDVLSLAARQGAIDRDAGAMLQEIVELTGLKTCDIMVPRVDMIARDLATPRAGFIQTFRDTGLTRLPVYDGDADNIVGMIVARTLLLSPRKPLRELLKPITFVPEAASVERLLVGFRANSTKLAIVVDEYGGTAGLVTLEDILEEIAGQMPDPRESVPEPAVREIGDELYMIDGNLPIHEWADAFDIDLRRQRITTVGGFVTWLLGRIPRVGDTATYRNLHFTVESMHRRRIGKLRLQLYTGDE
ncbi:MAG: hemolysin family protein [Phycisphaerae bacterium]|jgi:putative hemolysin|nr:hemolysin family protein [Phycisphaerae bacterium]